jgi:hypothetical protein
MGSGKAASIRLVGSPLQAGGQAQRDGGQWSDRGGDLPGAMNGELEHEGKAPDEGDS